MIKFPQNGEVRLLLRLISFLYFIALTLLEKTATCKAVQKASKALIKDFIMATDTD